MRIGLASFLAGIVLSAHQPIGPAPQPPRRDDQRVATVLDEQGASQVRPSGRDRWSPLWPKMPLAAGDLVRTSPRGANAVEFVFAGGKAVLGPGSQVEIGAGAALRLLAGDLEVTPAEGQRLTVRGPNATERAVATRTVLQATDTGLTPLTSDPRWLVGYRGSTTDEWMGSLIAQIDGRDVPLHVGYHKVTVEIRDQIARTTVEESFVNSTAGRLEGTFLFPLPADASVSGFGMWIGDELVEADIVEKQRARAIYEQILRERRDPGLLEWEGGNLFKARVFPIEARSEKRVRIRYTQVLPLQGSEVVYRYALRSEMLRSRPLRDLAVDVVVDSTAKIDAVASPTHAMRLQHTEHAARAEFTAQEYVPDRDLEVHVALADPPNMMLLPHRRGDDGYFALLLRTPGEGGRWQRELVPDGTPLDLVVLADTSASMDPAARRTQRAFLDALLGLLGEKDHFQVFACDVDARPLHASASATAPAIARALDALGAIDSLGWTDLDRAFAAAGDAPGRVVVYVGDGIGTARGDSNPAVLAQRLTKLPAQARHVVTVSSTYEASVLAALAGSGGSMRDAATTPARCAFDLLAEVARPPLQNLSLRFEGLRTARVYPETLPNLADGRQQVIVGRYLPTAGAQRGKVFVRGTRAGRPAEFSTEVELPADDAGNSFVPRLWARRHVDALLAQGDVARVKDDVVALSEEFNIMTPLTSLLVLESDADRERFGVQRRVQMRDGEQFFADGRDHAATELRREQMRRARAWRLDLKAKLLAELAAMGDDLYGWNVAVGDLSSLESPRDVRSITDELAVGESGDTRPEEAAGFDADDDSNAVAAERAEEQDDKWSMVAAKSDAGARFHLGKQGTLVARQREQSAPGFFARKDRRPASHFAFPFPPLAPAPQPTPEQPAWPPEVVAALRSANLRAAITDATTGFVVESEEDHLHPRRQHVVGQQRQRLLAVGDAWCVDLGQLGDQRTRNWKVDGDRGCAWLGLGTARRRSAEAGDRIFAAWPLLEADADWVAFAATSAEIVARAGERLTVALRPKSGDGWRTLLTVDTARGVVLERRVENGGKTVSTTRITDFVDAAGRTWPARAERTDGDGNLVARLRFTVQPLALADAKAKVLGAVAECKGFLFLPATDPSVDTSKTAIAERRAEVVHHLVLAAHFAGNQQWEPAFAALRAAQPQAEPTAAWPWLRLALLSVSRRGEELTELVNSLAATVVERAAHERAFLAAYVLARTPLHAQEKLRWLDRVADALTSEGEAREARQRVLHERRAEALAELGRWADVADERQLLRGICGRDLAQLLALAAAQENCGRHAEALATCAEADTWPGSLDTWESQQLYGRWTELLFAERDLDRIVAVAKRWTTVAPSDEQGYLRWVSALVYAGRVGEADAWMRGCLAETPGDDEPRLARMRAALQFALGQGWNFYRYRLDERYAEPVAAMVLRLLDGDGPALELATRALQHWYFVRTDAGRACRRALVARLAAPGSIETWPLPRLNTHLAAVSWAEQTDAVRAAIQARVRARFSTLQTDAERSLLGPAYLTVASARGHDAEVLAFLRDWLAEASPAQVASVARQLFDALAREPWTEQVEGELLRLAPRLVSATEPEARRGEVASVSRTLASNLVKMRERALLGAVADLERLPRAVRRANEAEARNTSRRAVAATLGAAAAAEPDWRPWLRIEALVLAARTAADARAVDGEARELLASLTESDSWTNLLRERCALVIGYLASRPAAPSDLGDQAVRLCRDGIARGDDRIAWRQHLLRLLLVLDRPDAALAALQEWIATDALETPWRVALAYLLAERGDLRAAALQLETVATRDELVPADAKALASWYLALGDDTASRAASDRALDATPEWELSQRLWRDVQRLTARSEQPPPTLETTTLDVLRALLRKASNPQGYVWQLDNLYRTTKDFRVLTSLAESCLGHTPQSSYALLRAGSDVIGNVHEEATCDALRERITALRAGATTATDRRALWFLELACERRAAKVRNQPGPHAQRALACLVAAGKEDWQSGEPLQVAQLLAALGAMEDSAVAAEQLRQLRALVAIEPARSLDGLQIAHALGQTLASYGRLDDAIDELSAALTTYRQSQGGRFGAEANPTCDILVDDLMQRGRFAAAEAFVRGELALQSTREQHDHFTLRLFDVANACVQQGGSMSWGNGEELYRGALAAMRGAAFTCRPDQVPQVHDHLLALHRLSASSMPASTSDLATWAYGDLFEVASRNHEQASQLFAAAADLLATLAGPRAGVELLVTRLEKEPPFLAWMNRDGWQTFASKLGEWRQRAKLESDLEQRLRRLLFAELRRDLGSGEQRNRAMLTPGAYFWAELRPEFVAVAKQVAGARAESSDGLLWIADYLDSLEERDLALTLLLDGEARGKLDPDARTRLIDLLLRARRAAEAVPIAKALVDLQPDVLQHRCTLARALATSDERGAADAVLAAAEERLRAQQRLDVPGLAALADAASTCGLHERTVRLYAELVPLYQRRTGHLGQTDGTLATYYGNWARALVALGRHDEAVDVAAAGVVAWGRRLEDQRSALQALQAVLAQIPDLDAYVGRWSARVATSGRDAPALRKALASVFLERKDHERGTAQLRLALDLQPLDEEAHRMLVGACAARGDRAGEVAALLAWTRAFPMNVETYARLGEVLEPAAADAAERAWTSTVELLPNEADGHRRLAEHRRGQKRFADEVRHRQRVTEIRTDEPEGWFLLAQAQADAGDVAAAARTLTHVCEHTWDVRFGAVAEQARGRLDALRAPRAPR